MKKFMFGLLLGLVAGAWGFWYYQQNQNRTTLEKAADSMIHGAEKVEKAIKDAVGEIRTEDIKKELEKTSMVVREKAARAGEVLSGAAANARISSTIKAKLITEPTLSALTINVDTTDGLVTLSGTVSSHEQIAKAVRIALDTEGVTKVISTLQVKPGK